VSGGRKRAHSEEESEEQGAVEARFVVVETQGSDFGNSRLVWKRDIADAFTKEVRNAKQIVQTLY
jgi:hypothetical protein